MDWEIMGENLPVLLGGLGWTLAISLVGMVLALGMGVGLVALGRTPWGWVRGLVRFYTELILGLPILVLLYLLFFLLPSLGIVLEPLVAGVLTLMLYYAPYVAEILRGGLAAIPLGQIEAAQTVGMAPLAIHRRIVLPQMLGLVLPPLTGQFIGLIKDSAILSVISVKELTFIAKQVISRTYAPFEIYILIAVGYWLLTFGLEWGLRRWERLATVYR
jgi:polar amino acid transport system permease protein